MVIWLPIDLLFSLVVVANAVAICAEANDTMERIREREREPSLLFFADRK